MAKAQGPMTYAQVAGAVGIYPISQVARDLQRYTRFGYVRRWKVASKYRYEITRRGLERVAFFTKNAPDSGAAVHQKCTKKLVLK